MRIGIHAAQTGRLADPAAVRAVAVAAEQVGYSAIWAGDPVGAGQADLRFDLDPLAVLGASAEVTNRVRLGAGVLVASRYQPDVLARSLRSLDAMSDGRLTIGLRAPAEHVPAHLDQLAPADGERSRRPPVLVAASTEEELDLVARRADGWIAESLPVARFMALREHLVARAQVHGRDGEDLQVVVRADIALTHDPTDELTDESITGERAVFTGALAQVVDDIVAIGQAGADEVILHVARDCSLDELLGTYAEVTEAVEALLPITS
jgi:alkanesulfonate monooxygenase SsuD/methylene tetrahydromethanopterin reductase-like flavin-dependent oxidoreductase (luciferase family)